LKLAHKVLVVDDEPQIRRLMLTALRRADYAVIEAGTARDAMGLLHRERPDVVLLDLGLPDRDGLELIQLIKRQPETTLIVVSAREATEEKVAALDLGADDYLTKPFDTDELLARVRVALRHRATRDGGEAVVKAGDVAIDIANRMITKAGCEVHLTPKEFDVLSMLARADGRVVSHKQIMASVWPREVDHRVEYLRVLVRSLRQKLEDDPQRPALLCNELGVGYRLRIPKPQD